MPSHEGAAPRAPEEPSERQQRRKRIVEGLQGRELEQAIVDKRLWKDILDEADSDDPDKLVTRDAVRVVEEARARQLAGPALSLFFSTDDVIIVPGFLGSELVDVTGKNGLIWIDPQLLLGRTEELNDLRLSPLAPDATETDATDVVVRPNGAIPLIYGVLKYDLEVRRYSARIFGIDWRKNLDSSALALAETIRMRADQRFRPLHVIAHSQGTLVARRALQFLGAELARRLVMNLVLLGPATAGSFSAVTALTGNHSLLELVRRNGIIPPPGFEKTIQSMSGIYQLIPWRTEATDRRSITPEMARPLEWIRTNLKEMRKAAFWPQGIDTDRLDAFLEWGKTIDAGFFNDRTTIILGDQPTVGGVKLDGGMLVADDRFKTTGDGTVPDALALIGGVSRVYKSAETEHMMLPATLSVIAAVRDILADRAPQVKPFGLAAATGTPFPVLAVPAPVAGKKTSVVASSYSVVSSDHSQAAAPRMAGDILAPPVRRLRVFSFDPLMATELDALGTEQICLELPWDFADGNQLQPGPVGEYIEVIDCDPASGCVYPPIDLNHPHVLAQSGLPPSEGDPRFHQQMVYAVAMNTIRQFEVALGRKVLWSPRLERDETGKVIPHPKGMPPEQQAEREFVQRLRIYPHAMRQPNAYYHPEKKALLFGYFPAEGQEGDRNLPGGMVFTCLSHDVVAHETTHALLDGLHRYFAESSNPDVFAFHEAFADIVALLQHFSHPEVLRKELALARGDLTSPSKLGVLAAQFGEATGHHGALRQYLGRKNKEGTWEPIKSDPSAIRTVTEPHARGALLVAALFRAFTNIYENRVTDLRRIATGGSGLLPEGDLHPDLVTRMAEEAAKSARHLLTMCIRALDYVPPVDVTFGEYLRALITSDYDLVRDDDRRYRVSIVAAFRDWGIYPGDVRSLSIDNLLWSDPPIGTQAALRDFLKNIDADGWDLNSDRRRAFEQMKSNSAMGHRWLKQVLAKELKSVDRAEAFGRMFGLSLGAGTGLKSIRRGKDGWPIFEVHSFRPCRRIGPDGQQRTEFVVEMVQRRKAFFDLELQARVDSGKLSFRNSPEPDFWFRGGCTVLIDPLGGRIRYCIRKPIDDDERLGREREFHRAEAIDGFGGLYLDSSAQSRNPFAFLHGGR